MSILDKIFWRMQKPSPLDSVVRKEKKLDEVIGKFLFLVGAGLMGMFMLGLILLGN